MKQYDKILFDVDGTLLDFRTAEQKGLEQVLSPFCKDGSDRLEELLTAYRKLNHELWNAYEKGTITKKYIIDTRFPKLFRLFGIDGDGIETEEQYRQCLNRSAFPIDGALEICSYLSRRYELYVVTNGFTETQNQRMIDSGLGRYFKANFISEEVGSQKPQKEFFDYCFAHMESPDPFRMLIVGDSLQSDMKGGNVAGIHTCWFNPDGAVRDEAVPVECEIKSLLELKKFI